MFKFKSNLWFDVLGVRLGWHLKMYVQSDELNICLWFSCILVMSLLLCRDLIFFCHSV